MHFSQKKELKQIEKDLLSIFLDSSKRPKITPRHESAIIINLESNYSPGKIKSGLKKLEKAEILSSVKKKLNNIGKAKFYFLSKHNNKSSIQKIQNKIGRAAKWIEKYSDNKVTKMLGDHLHDIVKAELRVQSFEIIAEKTRKYREKEWTKTNHTLDIIAKHKTRNLTIGVEVKNMLFLVPKSEVSVKIEMCDYFGITPVFACRWLEPHRHEIVSHGGFLWQFKKQLYPRGQEKFVETLRKRFKFPVEVNSELPYTSIKEFENWIQTM